MSDCMRFDVILCMIITGIGAYQLQQFSLNYMSIMSITHSVLLALWTLSVLLRAPGIWSKYKKRVVHNLFTFGCIHYALVFVENGIILGMMYFSKDKQTWGPILPDYSQDQVLFIVTAPILFAASVCRLAISTSVVLS